MQKITFILPSRNNLELLKLAYKSVKRLKGDHNIIILDDASTDGTGEWLLNLDDHDLTVFTNKGPHRMGIVGMYNKGAQLAKTDIIFTFHADMVAGTNLDVNILKHLERGKVISATRIEPPLHPPGSEKIIENFGIEPEEFDWEGWVSRNENFEQNKTTRGIFAPWAIYKDDYLSIGGEDSLFAPQSKDDSDLFNRFVLNGYDIVQPWDALVYHFTSRGSRFNKKSGGSTGVDSPEWVAQNIKATRNFIRKWGHFVKHDEYSYPIIPPKYNIGLIVKNCNERILEHLEPWCSTIYVDCDYKNYIKNEQSNTLYDLSEKILPIQSEKNNDILVRFDSSKLNNNSFQYIQQLPEIIADDGELHGDESWAEFELDIFRITINKLKTYEHELICCSRTGLSDLC